MLPQTIQIPDELRRFTGLAEPNTKTSSGICWDSPSMLVTCCPRTIPATDSTTLPACSECRRHSWNGTCQRHEKSVGWPSELLSRPPSPRRFASRRISAKILGCLGCRSAPAVGP